MSSKEAHVREEESLGRGLWLCSSGCVPMDSNGLWNSSYISSLGKASLDEVWYVCTFLKASWEFLLASQHMHAALHATPFPPKKIRSLHSSKADVLNTWHIEYVTQELFESY